MTNVKVQAEEDALVVALEGALVLAESQSVKETVKTAIEEDGRFRVIIDLSLVDFIDSSGLGVLIGWFKLVNQAQGAIVYVGLSEYVQKIIALAKLDKIFPISATIAEAKPALVGV